MSVLSVLCEHPRAPLQVLDVPWRAEGETPVDEAARAHLVCDWLIRVYTPAFLRLVPALVTYADALEAKAGVSRAGRVRGAKLIDAASNAAWNAAWNAASNAAWNAAWNAALQPAVDSILLTYSALIGRVATCAWFDDEEQGYIDQSYPPDGCLQLWRRGPDEAARIVRGGR